MRDTARFHTDHYHDLQPLMSGDPRLGRLVDAVAEGEECIGAEYRTGRCVPGAPRFMHREEGGVHA